MLVSVQFENYRCFVDNRMQIKDLTIIVGKNNAGKSTVIEGLRMLANAGIRASITPYVAPPKELNLPAYCRGFQINTDRLKIDLRTIIYFYQDRIAKITGIFKDRSKIVIYATNELAFACLYDPEGEIIPSRGAAQRYSFGNIAILPQIGLIRENEKYLSKGTVIADKETYLSSRHFRNEILVYKNLYFNDFCKLAETTWPGLKISEISYSVLDDEYLSLLVEDNRFTAELGLMGSGLQMWLQIIWFICRSKECTTIIFDEPDVYMHPDLQRRLVRFIKSKFKQAIIATHSVEILSEVDIKNIISIDKNCKHMRYADSKKSVQRIVDDIGSVQNITLIRIATAKKCLFVEGEDTKILSKFYNILYPDSIVALSNIPIVPLNGRSRIDEALGAAKLFFDETLGNVKCHCIIDRDFYPDEELADQRKKAEENHLTLHIWTKKEIENYLFVPQALFRITGQSKDMYSDFCTKLESLVDTFEESTVDQYSTKIHEYYHGGKAPCTCNQLARAHVRWKERTLEEKLSLVGGKEFLHSLNDWIRENFNRSCSWNKIINNIMISEVDPEMKEILDEILSLVD